MLATVRGSYNTMVLQQIPTPVGGTALSERKGDLGGNISHMHGSGVVTNREDIDPEHVTLW